MDTNVSCPECGNIIEINHIETKEQVKCENCGFVVELNSKKK